MKAIIVALLLTVLLPMSSMAQETVASPQSAEALMQSAAYLASVGDVARARQTYYAVLEQYPGTVSVDKAAVGIAKTFLAEEDYRRSIAYLEDVLVKAGDLEARTEARQLYTTLEANFRRARTRAETQYQEAKTEYDDISWFNIFKIFTKLKLRSEMKNAKKDLDNIGELHNLFNPRLLVEPDYSEPAETTEVTEDTTVADAGETEDTGDAADGEDESMDKQRAYELLKEEIAALIAMIPDSALDGNASVSTDETMSSETGEETTEVASAPETSEEASEETTEVASAPETSEEVSEETTEEAPAAPETSVEPETTIVIGEDSKPSEEETTSVASTDTTTDTTSVASTEVTTTEEEALPAAPTVASLSELKDAYISAYRRYMNALHSNDRAAISAALNEYRTSLRSYQSRNALETSQGQPREQPVDAAPSAPTSSTEAVPSAPKASDTSGDAPAAPVSSTVSDATARPIYGREGNVGMDQSGRVSGRDNRVLQGQRRSFQR